MNEVKKFGPYSSQGGFSEENLKRAGIVRRFENLKMEKCLSEITELIREEMTSL